MSVAIIMVKTADIQGITDLDTNTADCVLCEIHHYHKKTGWWYSLIIVMKNFYVIICTILSELEMFSDTYISDLPDQDEREVVFPMFIQQLRTP